MSKKEELLNKKYKKHIRFKRLIVFIIVFLILSFFAYKILTKKIDYIQINKTKYFTEQEILDILNIKDYNSFISINTFKLEKKLKNQSIIKDCKVTKDLFKLKIEIEEYKVLWYYIDKDMYMIETGDLIKSDRNIMVPSIKECLEEKQQKKFIKAFNSYSDDIIEKISEITYSPTNLDSKRYLFYMNDQNYVYINTSKLDTLNKYNDIVLELEGHKGILYLDSGNHFEIKR